MPISRIDAEVTFTIGYIKLPFLFSLSLSKDENISRQIIYTHCMCYNNIEIIIIMR